MCDPKNLRKKSVTACTSRETREKEIRPLSHFFNFIKRAWLRSHKKTQIFLKTRFEFEEHKIFHDFSVVRFLNYKNKNCVQRCLIVKYLFDSFYCSSLVLFSFLLFMKQFLGEEGKRNCGREALCDNFSPLLPF